MFLGEKAIAWNSKSTSLTTCIFPIWNLPVICVSWCTVVLRIQPGNPGHKLQSPQEHKPSCKHPKISKRTLLYTPRSHRFVFSCFQKASNHFAHFLDGPASRQTWATPTCRWQQWGLRCSEALKTPLGFTGRGSTAWQPTKPNVSNNTNILTRQSFAFLCDLDLTVSPDRRDTLISAEFQSYICKELRELRSLGRGTRKHPVSNSTRYQEIVSTIA